ncbi:MAG: DUF2007 domain-containing protein [Gemmataceae bacterium]
MRTHEDPVVVYTVTDPIEAEIIRTALDAAGIDCFLDGMNQAELTALPALEVKVTVPSDQADEAREILAEHEANIRVSRGV